MKEIKALVIAILMGVSSLLFGSTPEHRCQVEAYNKRDTAHIKAEGTYNTDMMHCYDLVAEGHYTILAACQKAALNKFTKAKNDAGRGLALDLSGCSPVNF